MKKTACFTVIFSILLCAFISCRRTGIVSSIRRDDLFTLNYGSFENQINLFDLADTGNDIHTTIAMKNGFFYIANGEAKKILQMNSYGDLLSLYYNSEENPEPLFDAANINATGGRQKNQDVSTKKTIEYQFNTPSKICVDSKQRIYAVELLPPERQENEENRTLSQVVLRFDSEGFIDYIGQQGPGGTPFPYIKNIFTNQKNELIVICIVPEGLEVFWFSSQGYLLHNILINENDAPNPLLEKDDNIFFKVDNVVPDSKVYRLFVKIDYFGTVIDETSKIQSGIDYKATYIYSLDTMSGKYGKPVMIPPYEEAVTTGFSKQVYHSPYNFLGVSENDWLFFTATTDDGYIVQIVDPSGNKIIKRLLKFENDKVVYQNFNLSEEGIISAILATKEKADIVWWRTDSLIAALLKS